MGRNFTVWNGWTKIITFNPDSRHLMSGESYSADVRQWGVYTGEEFRSFGMKLPHGYVHAIAASMDGRWIVTGGDSGNQVIVWDAVTRTIARQISEHTGVVYAVDVSSDSTRIASGSADSTVRIFSIISGVRVIHPLELANAGAPTAVKFSPDGARVATATQTLVGIYDIHSGNKMINIPAQNTSSLAWSFDGQQLLFSSLGKLTCFDRSTSSHFKLAWFINHDSDNYNDNITTSIATYGRFVACATGLSVSFWDYALGQLIGSIAERTTVNCISISPDGKYLASGHQQGITVHHLADVLPGHYLRIPRVPRIPLLQLDDPALRPWALGNLTDALMMLSKEIESAQDSNPGYHAHTLAARSIVRGRLREWRTAIEDAEMSLQINQSPIGQIARSLALVGEGKQEIALDDFDLAFRDDPRDTTLLLIIKFIIAFICGKRKESSSRLHTLLTTSDEKTRGYYTPALGNMYLKQGDYESAVQTLVLSKNLSTPQDSNPLMTITLIFGWNFDHLEDIACQRLCESWLPSGRIKEIGETLEKMVSGLTDDEKEPAHCRILEELVTRSGQVTLLMWTGNSSRCNSCLPSSPAVYSRQAFVPPRLEPAELERRIDELRVILPYVDAMVIDDRITRLQPVRFSHSRLLLPCIVYPIKHLRKGKGKGNRWHAETAEFGDVEFTTADSLSFKASQRLVFADLRPHSFRLESDPEWNSSDMGSSAAISDAELVHAPMIEEVPLPSEPQLDTYTRALRLIARLGQPFSALLLSRQSDGSYRRVAADSEIVVRSGSGENVPKDIRAEVLEVL